MSTATERQSGIDRTKHRSRRRNSVVTMTGEVVMTEEVERFVDKLRSKAAIWQGKADVEETWAEILVHDGRTPIKEEEIKQKSSLRSNIPIVARYLKRVSMRRNQAENEKNRTASDVSLLGRSNSSASLRSSKENKYDGDPKLIINKNGVGYSSLLSRITQLEQMGAEKSFSPRFFLGAVASVSSKDDTPFVTFVLQWIGPQNVAALKQSIGASNVLSTLSDDLQADVVLQNVQGSVDVSKSRLFGRRRQRSHRSGSVQRLHLDSSQLEADFISKDATLLATWNMIRNNVSIAGERATWMVLGYHDTTASETSKSNPTSAPVLISRGSGGIEAFGSELIINSFKFIPGWLYWIYARVDVENFSGTGRFRAYSSESGPSNDGEGEALKRSGDKFILASFCIPAQNRAMFPTMSFRLANHRSILARVLKYHLYLEARSLQDLSESEVVSKVLNYSHSRKIVLTVFIGSEEMERRSGNVGASPSSSLKSMSSPLMIRIEPHALLSDLKKRIAQAYSWDPKKVIIMKLDRDNNAQVMRTLVSTKMKARSEAALTQQIRNATTNVVAKSITGDDKQLQKLMVVSGDELYVQLVNNQSRRASVQTVADIHETGGLVQHRRRHINDFLHILEKQQQYRAQMYKSLIRIGGNTNTSNLLFDDGRSKNSSKENKNDGNDSLVSKKASSLRMHKSKSAKSLAKPHQSNDAHASSRKTLNRKNQSTRISRSDSRRVYSQAAGSFVEMNTSPSKEDLQKRKKKMAAFNLGGQLAAGRAQLRQKKILSKKPPQSNTAKDLTRFNHSTELLQTLSQEAQNLGARIVDDEDLMIFNKRVLGDGRTARVREGLLLCKLEEVPGVALRGRSSKAINNRASWLRMRNMRSSFLDATEEDSEDEEDKGQLEQKRVSTVPSTLAKAGKDEEEGIFDFVALKVAVKMFTARFVTKVVFHQFLEEISVLAGLVHPSIVQILGVYIDQAPRLESTGTSLMIMYELMPRGSLRQLREMDSVWIQLPFTMKVKMALDVARGIEYLHTRSPPLIHRDLKSDNLLVDEDFTIKIGDFGISTRVEGAVRSKVGTGGWIAPEVLMDTENGYGLECDIFSFGVILWEIVTSESNPFAGMVEEKYVACLEKGERPVLPRPVDSAQKAYNKLVKDCWSFHPEERPSASEVVDRLTDVMSKLFK